MMKNTTTNNCKVRFIDPYREVILNNHKDIEERSIFLLEEYVGAISHDKVIKQCGEEYKNKGLSALIVAATESYYLNEYHYLRMHSHQCRIGKARLEIYRDELLRYEEEIGQRQDFESLLSFLRSERCLIKGIGNLTTYDIALRIGFHTNRLPETVHLHAGVIEGLKNLIASLDKAGISHNFKKREAVKVSDFPVFFHDYECCDIETMLCTQRELFKM